MRAARVTIEDRLATLERRVDTLERIRWVATIEGLVQRASGISGHSAAELRGGGTSGSLVAARFAVVWAARSALGRTFAQIGEVLGGRDHTTIASAYRRSLVLRAGNADFRALSDAVAAGVEP